MSTHVYYSVSREHGGGAGVDVKTGAPTITISGGVATLSVAQVGNIGQGIEIDYDVGNSICYISLVNSSTSFNVITATGGIPGDVTGKTVNSIKHTWNSLAEAEAAWAGANYLNNASLVAIDTVLHIACYYDADDFTSDGRVTISGTTTDSTRYIHIYTPQGGNESINDQRHPGFFDNTKYQLTWGGANFVIGQQGGHVRSEGLQLIGGLADVYQTGGGVEDCRIDGCVIKGGSTAGQHGINLAGIAVGGEVRITNNVIYDVMGVGGAGISFLDGNLIVYVYNNTIKDCRIGILNSSVSQEYIKNNIIDCIDGFSGAFFDDDTFNDYNYTSENFDETAGPLGSHGEFNRTFTFAEIAGNDDFHLDGGDTSGALGGGIGPGSEGEVPTDDIDGDVRSGATCDVGMDEYVDLVTSSSFSSSSSQSSSSSSSVSTSSQSSVSSSSSTRMLEYPVGKTISKSGPVGMTMAKAT